ncbi:unnamed protein product [Orchesella dallaii]|uniref:Uncharacterized protein n=1 Tax=Orchesella dallaii TaxID=48710 RepID=A0ABP1RLA1_9HEXA
MPLASACLILCKYKIVPWKTILCAIGVFSVCFLGILAYCATSTFTSLQTSLIVAFSTASFITVGVLISKTYRYAVLVGLVNSFSLLGLATFFFLSSWITISTVLADFFHNLDIIQSFSSCLNNGTRTNASLLDNGNKNATSTDFQTSFLWHIWYLEVLGSVIHYSFFVPIILVFTHAFVYTCTFPYFQKNGTQRSSGSVRQALVKILKTILLFSSGSVLGMTLSLFYFQHLFALSLHVENEVSLHCSKNPKLSSCLVIYAYLIFSGILLIFVRFSSYTDRLRSIVLSSFGETKTITTVNTTINQVVAPNESNAAKNVDQKMVLDPRSFVDGIVEPIQQLSQGTQQEKGHVGSGTRFDPIHDNEDLF